MAVSEVKVLYYTIYNSFLDFQVLIHAIFQIPELDSLNSLSHLSKTLERSRYWDTLFPLFLSSEEEKSQSGTSSDVSLTTTVYLETV